MRIIYLLVASLFSVHVVVIAPSFVVVVVIVLPVFVSVVDVIVSIIPSDLYEAAKAEGASRWQTFIKITIPLLMPIIFFLLLIVQFPKMLK